MCIAVAYKKVKNRRGRLRELAFYQRFQLQGFDWDNLDCFGLLDLCSLMGGSHLRNVVAHWGSTVLRMEWRWCELRKFKFKRRYDHRSGNCNRKKKFRDFNGIQTHGLCVSAALLHQLSYKDPDTGNRPNCRFLLNPWMEATFTKSILRLI